MLNASLWFSLGWELLPEVASSFYISILCQEAAPCDIKDLKVLLLYSVALKIKESKSMLQITERIIGSFSPLKKHVS